MSAGGLSDSAALGPVCALGIICAVVAQLGVLPALLAIVGRGAFWPFVPRPSRPLDSTAGLWSRVAALLRAHPRAVTVGGARVLDVAFAAPPASAAAQRTVTALRARARAAGGPRTLVGGETATNIDLAAAAAHDRTLIIPIVLAVVLAMLALLLRALLAPVLLVLSVLLSYLASLGVSAVVFRGVFGFVGFDPSVPIFGFVFLVALGVDYNIFLMARAREEAAAWGSEGIDRALAVTGAAVVSSAGVVLAATFALLGVLPLVALTEVGFLVAFGVLIDTLLVRGALVPALAIDIGAAWRWPLSPAAQTARTLSRPGDWGPGAPEPVTSLKTARRDNADQRG